MNLTLEEIGRYTSGTVTGSGSVKVRGYSIDTRTIKPGELFFAIKGPRFDGHQFVRQALERGAAGAVVSSGTFEATPSFAVIRVGSTVEALHSLARQIRRKWGSTVIGITGSVGKTTTKEMVAAVLGKQFPVLRSLGNLNNEYGLPLCLLRVENYQKMAVLEMGMSARGEIRRLASIAEPNEGVVTNVSPVHLEFFKSVEEIAEAKQELLDGLVDPKTAYLNNDDPRVRAMSRKFNGKILTFGIKSVASFRVKQVQDLGLDGTAFTVHHGRRDVNFVLRLLGQHNVSNALAAISVGLTHGIAWEAVREAIGEMKPEKMRGEVIKFREGFVVIDDTYNSNPRAFSEMIHFLARLQGFKRKILVAGEMLELGSESPELHRNCGRDAARAGVSFIIGVQGNARELMQGARESGMAPAQLKFARDAMEAGDLLVKTLQKGDVALVKGSRAVKLEQVLDTLRLAFSSLEP